MFTVPTPVLLDLNTQRDLVYAEGSVPYFQGEKLIDPLRQVFTMANRAVMPVISTRLHNEVVPGQKYAGKRVCDPNSPGYQKLPFMLLKKRIEWPLDCSTSLPIDGFRTTQQFVFDLPSLNLFECPRLDRLLSESTVDMFIIVGGPLEWTLRTAVLGLLARRHRVAVVSDAIAMWDPYEGDMAYRQVESKNIEWMTAAQALERFGVAPKVRTTRLLRSKNRAVQQVGSPVAPKTTTPAPSRARGAYRV